MIPDYMTQEFIKQFLHYDPETGEWTWIKSVNSRVEAGDAAGTISVHGYRIITLFTGKYRAARLAFLYMTGVWPTQEVDHIDRCKLNDRWENLRDVSRSENQINRDMQFNNTSGAVGVYWRSEKNKWCAQVKRDNEVQHIGYYETIEEAVAAREAYLASLSQERTA